MSTPFSYGYGYGYGTGFHLSSFPYAQVAGGRAMCPDGKVRTLTRIGEADTYWTRPAAARVRGRYVRGYVTLETAEGWQTPSDADPLVLKFVAHPSLRKRAFPGVPATWTRNA